MPRGGKREGAGRKPNTPNKVTQELQAEVEATGKTPLEVLLSAMRDAYDKNDHSAACKYAAMAAPFVHPKLSAIEHTGKDGAPLAEAPASSRGVARAILDILHGARIEDSEEVRPDHPLGEEKLRNLSKELQIDPSGNFYADPKEVARVLGIEPEADARRRPASGSAGSFPAERQPVFLARR